MTFIKIECIKLARLPHKRTQNKPGDIVSTDSGAVWKKVIHVVQNKNDGKSNIHLKLTQIVCVLCVHGKFSSIADI